MGWDSGTQHYTCNISLNLKTLNSVYKLWNTLYSRCIGTLWPNHFDFNLQTSGGIHAARDIWNADVYSQEVVPVTLYFWQAAVNSTDIPVAQVVPVTERSRNSSHVYSCGYTFFKSRIRETASLKETLTNRNTHGLIFSHGWQSHRKMWCCIMRKHVSRRFYNQLEVPCHSKIMDLFL